VGGIKEKVPYLGGIIEKVNPLPGGGGGEEYRSLM